MALINCPECNKHDISDTAEQCPYCGYAVKAHFEQMRRKQEIAEKQKRIEIKTNEEMLKLQTALDKELEEVDQQPYPVEPSYFRSLFLEPGCSATYWTIGIFIGAAILGRKTGSIIFALIMTADLLFIPILLYICYLDYKSDMYRYKENTRDWEKTKEKKKEGIRKEYYMKASNMARYGQYTTPSTNYDPLKYEPGVVMCPKCQSIDVRKISFANQYLHWRAFGMASKTTFSDYKCNRCGHKW